MRYGRMSAQYWELIYEKLYGEGFNVGHVGFIDAEGREMWCADAGRDGKRWVVHAENLAAAYLEIENQTRDASSMA